MAATRRSIVTHQPEVACDLCGRRLLRGERPDVFVAAERRRTVCELCAPRAANEGWLRASEVQGQAVGAERGRRGFSLIDRLRQMRSSADSERAEPTDLPIRRPRRSRRGFLHEDLDGDPDGIEGIDDRDGQRWHDRHEPVADAVAEPALDAARHRQRQREDPTAAATAEHLAPPQAVDAGPADATPSPQAQLPVAGVSDGSRSALQGALEIFNSSACAARVAGIARSLGEPCVAVRPLQGPQDGAAITVSWELCWYRYEVCVDPEDASARVLLAADGMELGELPDDERVANAVADEHGELSLLV